ncbi:MAG: magnesium transporter [Gammaproteobacteria bacterium]|jgi:magnesium transporter
MRAPFFKARRDLRRQRDKDGKMDTGSCASPVVDEHRLRQLVTTIRRRAPLDSVTLLVRESNDTIAQVLSRIDSTLAVRILSTLPEHLSEALAPSIATPVAEQWSVNLGFPSDSVGRLMEPVVGLYPPAALVADVVEHLRPMAEDRQVVYAFVVDEQQRLEGVVAMRELLFAQPGNTLADLMVTEPFYFRADAMVDDAMRAVLSRHYPIYPVCDEARRLLGIVRGYAMFEHQTLALTAQAGRMVGIEGEEHLSTPVLRSLRLRHPWLQLNLLTAFAAGAVVGLFEGTIAQAVALAVFLPVLAGQSGNTGCQALAVTLRGMTLNELKPGMARALIWKEAVLGLSNGALVGVSAALAMLVYAHFSGSSSPALLALTVFLAMLGACFASGVTGVLVPLALRRLGVDPATASTIFVTTATDVVSIGLLLGLATMLVL